jgi:outer membrane protein TolC
MLSHWWIGLIAAASPDRISLADAITSALTKNPAIQAERELVRSAEADALALSGPFDFVVDSAIGHRRQYTPYTPSVVQIDNITQFRLGLSKQLPFGLLIEPSIELYRRDSVIPAVVSGTVAPQNVAVLRLQLRQPILRGFGAAASANLDAAEQIAVAAGHEARQLAAERVLSVVMAYWRYAGALRGVAALREAEQRAEQMVREGRELVAADQRPRADLEPLQASLADRTRARLLAEQDALDAKSMLGLEMGLMPEEIAALSLPASELPEPVTSTRALSAAELEAAIARRDDLRAAELRIAAAQILVEASQNGALPELDLQGEVGYAGIVEGSSFGRVFEPIASNIPGVNVGASLVLRWPVENSAARGVLARAVSERRRAQIQRDDIDRRVRTQLALAQQSLRTSLAALARARRAQRHYRAAVENERIKLMSGHATVIDVILTEDRTSAANLAEINSHVGYAIMLAQLAFIGADLLRGEGEDVQVNLQGLLQ